MENEEKNKVDYNSRRMARLAAVQGLYQCALSEESAEALVKRFNADPCVLLQEERAVIAVDKALFGEVLLGTTKHQDDLDALIGGALDARFSAKRIELLLRSILRAGAFELHYRPDVAVGIIVNDYVDVAKGFFDAKEPGLVNAVLDRLAKKLRG